MFVHQKFKGNRRSELEHLQLGITSLLNVSVHVHLVVVGLLHLNDETLECSVFIAIELSQKVLRACGNLRVLITQRHCVLVAECERQICHWQIVLEDHASVVGVVAQHVVHSFVYSD